MTKKWCICVLIVAGLAIWLRLPALSLRPMHGDEAVHAYKFGRLLEQNYYRYDSSEFHGPTLNYFTLIPAWLAGVKTYAALTEFDLRIVPVLFGVILVLMPLLLADGLGKPAAVIAAVLTAISPAFVFYSRYYIQEMLLVCFTFCAIVSGYRYARSKNLVWALLTGLFLGLMYATKETCVIAYGSMLGAFVLTRLTVGRGSTKAGKPLHLAAAIAVAVAVSALFYSSFLTNPSGVLDSLRAYTTYFGRAGHSQIHNHPWYYYLKLLLYTKSATGPPWTEALIVFLSAAGLAAALARKRIAGFDARLLIFLGFYTLAMTVVYSLIPYKTPWCLLGFFNGMILLAGVGAVVIIKLTSKMLVRVIVGAFLFIVGIDLLLQAFLASYVSYADHNNPYVYAHPTKDVFLIAKRVEEVAAAHPDGFGMPVQVICPGDDYWPLPWYLRHFSNVGYWSDVSDKVAPTPVVIASPEVEERLIARLYEGASPGQKNLYMPLFGRAIQLRPEIELRGYVTKDLLDRLQRLNASKGE
jgi:uncharacterized protein (TIGR03663 family)